MRLVINIYFSAAFLRLLYSVCKLLRRIAFIRIIFNRVFGTKENIIFESFQEKL